VNKPVSARAPDAGKTALALLADGRYGSADPNDGKRVGGRRWHETSCIDGGPRGKIIKIVQVAANVPLNNATPLQLFFGDARPSTSAEYTAETTRPYKHTQNLFMLTFTNPSLDLWSLADEIPVWYC